MVPSSISRSLRVSLVIGTLDRGGTEGQVIALAKLLDTVGVETSVVCLERSGDDAAALRTAGVSIAEGRFEGLSHMRNPAPILRRLAGIRRAIAVWEPDVVQCFLYWGNLLGAPLARSARVPVVLSSRRSLAAVRGHHGVLRPWEIMADRLADAVVCNSEAARADAARLRGFPLAKARVIRNGVELPDDLSPPQSGGPVRILTVANLIAYKGHEHLLHAYARARRVVGPGVMRLDLAGRGPDEERLRRLAGNLGIDQEVAFLGSVPNVGELLRGCSFTVLPSLSEGLPNAVLESMAHARAVIASRVGGVPEILGDGGGVMLPPGDPEALADAIVDLASSPERRSALGARGRRIAEERFSMERMVGETLSLYRELLGRKGIRIPQLDEMLQPRRETADAAAGTG